MKNSHDVESYVKYNLSRRQRSLSAQLCSGTLPLAVETGRFNDISEEDRVCFVCNFGETEKGIHFLFYCPSNDDLRDLLFRKMP